MKILLNNGNEIDVGGNSFYRYPQPQKRTMNTVFIMLKTFDDEYDGYIVEEYAQYNPTVITPLFFWHETLKKYGQICQIPGYFNDEQIIKINIIHSDGRNTNNK